MVTIINAQIYSIKCGQEVAYEIEYSEGTFVRSVESVGNIIRKEWKKNGVWIMVGKPYVVNHSKIRNAEVIKATVKEFLAAV